MSKINLNYSGSKINELLAKIDSQNFSNYLLNTGGILNGRYSLGTNAYIANNSGGRILGYNGSNTIIGNTGGITNLEAANLNVRVSNGESSYKVLTEADRGINIVPLDTSGKISSQYLPSSIRGDILLLNEDSNNNNVSSPLIEFSGYARYYGPFIVAERSLSYGTYGRKDLKIYQRKEGSWPENYTNHFVAMVVDAQGNVGIGTETPVNKLEVYGNIGASGTMTATATYHSSDERLKTFEGDVVVDLEKVKALPKKYFHWTADADGKRQLGTSAQAVEEVFPELVSTNADGYKSVNYANLSVVALAAVDKLAEQNSELKRRLEKIEKLLNIE